MKSTFFCNKFADFLDYPAAYFSDYEAVSLDFSDQQLAHFKMHYFKEKFPTKLIKGIIDIDLHNNFLFDKGSRLLAETLKDEETVKVSSLNLERNFIGDIGAGHAASLILNSRMAEHAILNLTDNELTDKGAIIIARMLQSVPSCFSLILRKNGIGDVGAKALVKAMEKIAQGFNLDLSDNQLTDESAFSIAEQIPKMPAYTSLNLSANSLTLPGLISLCKSLSKAPEGFTLNISDNNNGLANFGDDILAELIEVLKKKGLSRNLTINIANLGITKKSGEALLAFAESHRVPDAFCLQLGKVPIPQDLLDKVNDAFKGKIVEEALAECTAFHEASFDKKHPISYLPAECLVAIYEYVYPFEIAEQKELTAFANNVFSFFNNKTNDKKQTELTNDTVEQQGPGYVCQIL